MKLERAVLAAALVGCGLGCAARERGPADLVTEPDTPAGEPRADHADLVEAPGAAEGAPSGPQESAPSPRPDPITPVPITWNAIAGFVYALEVIGPDGGSIRFCFGPEVLGSSTGVTFDGVCPSQRDRFLVAPADVEAYRLYYANDGVWTDYVEAPPGRTVTFSLPTRAPERVALSWPRRSPTAEYSLDLVLADGSFIGPCVGAHRLLRTLSYDFDGVCITPVPERRVSIADIREFRICSAENGNWAAATCRGTPYNGLRSRVALPE